MKPANLLGLALLLFGAVPLVYVALHGHAFVKQDWGFFAAVAFGAFLIDPADVKAFVASLKDLLPGKRCD